jgi:two-component system, LytTR family, response regulator
VSGRASTIDRPLRVLVADDEAIARKRLVRLLGDMPDVELVGQCADAHEVLAALRESEPDVVLLDIQMPDLSGLDAPKFFPPDGPSVVFCTAHAAHAVSAFDVGAVDYLLKPIDGPRLRKALDRARDRGAAAGASGTVAAPSLERLPLPTRQGIVLVDPRDITHAVLADELVTVYTLAQTYLSALSLQELESRLGGGSFVRVHRRALLNLAHVVRLAPNEVGGFVAETAGGHSVEVSRQAARGLRRRLGLRS